MTDRITTTKNGTTIYEGSGIEAFRLIAIASGLELYAKTKMKPNRDWTPTAMLRNASMATGKSYRRGAYCEAAADIRKVVNEMRKNIEFVSK